MQVQLRYRNIFCQTQTAFTMYRLLLPMYIVHLRIVLLVFIVRNVQNNLIDILSTKFISYAPYYIWHICWYRQMIIYNTVNRDYFDHFLTSNHFFTNFPMSNFIFEIWKMIPELLAFQSYIFIVFSYQGKAKIKVAPRWGYFDTFELGSWGTKLYRQVYSSLRLYFILFIKFIDFY